MYMQTVTTYWSGVNQIIDLKPNTTYIVFANTKDYGRVHAHILRADDSISRNLGDIIGPNYGGWADGSATFTTGADEVKIRLHSIIAPYDVIGPQLGYVDDIEMYELSSIEYVSGVKGYSIELNESMIIPDNSTELSGTEVYADLYEGVNYFAVRAVDNSGNLGDTNYYGPLYYCSGTLIDADNDDGAEIDPEDMDNICGVCGEPYIGYICSNDVDAELNGVCGDGYCTSYPDCCNSGDCLSGEFCSGANCPESFGTCEEGTDDPNIPEFSWTGLLLMIAITLIGSMMLIRSKKKKR